MPKIIYDKGVGTTPAGVAWRINNKNKRGYMNELINPNAKPLTKEQFYDILFGDNAKKVLEQEKAKEFYDKAHHQNNVELIKGRLWYTGNHIFNEFDCSKTIRAKQQLEMLRT